MDLLRGISAEVTCLIEDKKASAIFTALKPDLSKGSRDVRLDLRLKGPLIIFSISSKDVGAVKAFLTSFLKLIGAASATISSVSR